MNYIFSLLAGLLFGLGLLIAGMANPAKVMGFLDLAGHWDPSLALVLVSAISVSRIAFNLAKHRSVSILGLPIQLPTATGIDGRLVVGSLLFGIGWGLAGICPGPALVLTGAATWQGVLFVAAMLIGMGVFELLEYRSS